MLNKVQAPFAVLYGEDLQDITGAAAVNRRRRHHVDRGMFTPAAMEGFGKRSVLRLRQGLTKHELRRRTHHVQSIGPLPPELE